MSDTNTSKEQDLQKNDDILANIDSPAAWDLQKDTSEKPLIDILPWEDAGRWISDSLGKDESQTKIIDINLSSLEDIVIKIHEKEYDFVMIEPEDSQVKITFKQDNIDRNIVYIKYSTYTAILFKLKQIAGLVVENTKDTQEWQWKLAIDKSIYKLSTKTAPGQNGERIWLKSKIELSENGEKKVQKTPLSTIFAFLGAILFVCLVLGGTFISFVVFNAQEVSDVSFFSRLGINLQEINTFLSQIVTIIFSVLIFLFTIVLSISLFKFFLTKKALRRKKLTYGLVSLFLLVVTFMTWVLWMSIDQKIKNLPNWGAKDLQIFDNSLLISGFYNEEEAVLSETQNLIGPITLKFDLTNFQDTQSKKGLEVQRYTWKIWSDTIDTFIPSLTKSFENKGNYTVSITAYLKDINGQEIQQVISDIPPIALNHIIKVQSSLTSNGGTRVSLDANDLQTLGKVAWYFKEPVTPTNPNPSFSEWTRVYEGYDFIARQIFFEDMFIGVSLIGWQDTEEKISKVIPILVNADSEIEGEIAYNSSPNDELLLEFFVKNPKTSFGDGFIESYEWKIEDKTYNVIWSESDIETSKSIEHSFSTLGSQEIQVKLTDSKGNSETLKQTIIIQKSVDLRDSLVILDANDQEFRDFRYEEKSHEYYIDALGIPSTLKFDARYIRPENALYALKEVTWDTKNDTNIDGNGKSFSYEVETEWNHVIAVNYTFEHRKDPNDTLTLKEFIYIEGIKKEAILNLKMEYDSNYAPVTVRFDASESYIKNDNIIKFTYNYGDGVSEDRDAINPWHQYTKAWDYTVGLTVTGKSGKTYSIQKKLILLPAPQDVKISTSLKKAPVGQGIDFSSSESSGQIIEYFWDFGDGNISTDANPTHSYKKAWNYTVKLQVEFDNKNSISDEMEIEIQ